MSAKLVARKTLNIALITDVKKMFMMDIENKLSQDQKRFNLELIFFFSN